MALNSTLQKSAGLDKELGSRKADLEEQHSTSQSFKRAAPTTTLIQNVLCYGEVV